MEELRSAAERFLASPMLVGNHPEAVAAYRALSAILDKLRAEAELDAALAEIAPYLT